MRAHTLQWPKAGPVDLPLSWVGQKLTVYNDPPVIVFELDSLGAHSWPLDVDGWHIT